MDRSQKFMVQPGEIEITRRATMFIEPMTAQPAKGILPPGQWIAEEKFDGHRLLVRVNPNQTVTAWSRLGNQRKLPAHLNQALYSLPVGLYDGELVVPHGYSSSVTDLFNQKRLQYVVFDLLETGGTDITTRPWQQRRRALEAIFPTLVEKSPVMLTPITPVRRWSDVEAYVEQIWVQGGEGAMLKDINAPYKIGKRTRHFLKVKQCQSDVLTIVGFCPSEGEVMQLGDFGTAVLRSDDGIYTAVKVLDTDERRKLEELFKTGEAMQWAEARFPSGRKIKYFTNHPCVGRKLAIEYQLRTEDMSYRHPRWDHWEE